MAYCNGPVFLLLLPAVATAGRLLLPDFITNATRNNLSLIQAGVLLQIYLFCSVRVGIKSSAPIPFFTPLDFGAFSVAYKDVRA